MVNLLVVGAALLSSSVEVEAFGTSRGSVTRSRSARPLAMKDQLDSFSPESTVEISSPGQFYGATWATILNSKSEASVTAAQIEFFELVEEPKIIEEETAAESEDVAVESQSEARTEAQSSFFELEKKMADPAPEPKAVTPEPAKATTTSKEEIESTEKVIAIVKKQAATETKEKLKAKAEEPQSVPSPSSVEQDEPVPDELAEVPKRSVRKSLAQGAKLIVVAGLVVVARNVVKAYLGKGML